jgi:hypothetical protein
MPILEHEYHPIDYRNVCDLRKVSYAARALYLELFCAAGKTKHGVVDVRPALLEEESGIPASQIPALLAELVTACLIAYDAKNRIAYHAGSALRHCYNPNIRTGWTKIVGGLPAGPVKMAFESELAGVAWSIGTVSEPLAYGIGTVLEPLSNRFDNSNGNSNSNGNKNGNDEPSVAKATDTLAAPDVTRLALPMEAEPQADEVDPFADQPDPWSNIKPTVIDEVDLDYRPERKLTPDAQARVDRLKAEQAQQTLTLTPPKPSKTLTPTQLDAIFAKKRMAATVDLWNELLGKTTCGPCSHKEVAKMATQLMSNLAKYVSSEPGRDGSALIGWADAKSEYHSGRTGRTWTLQKWLTTEHLAHVFADYRNERGDERKIRYLPERTLRDWREAEEAREAWVNSQQGQVAA